jgi:hypothetical protein
MKVAVARIEIEEGVAAQRHDAAITLRGGEFAIVHRKPKLASYGHPEAEKYYAKGCYVDTFKLDAAPWQAATTIGADPGTPALVHLVAVHGCDPVDGSHRAGDRRRLRRRLQPGRLAAGAGVPRHDLRHAAHRGDPGKHRTRPAILGRQPGPAPTN